MSTLEPVVNVESLSVADRTGHLVLDTIDLRVPSGIGLGVAGASGAGKTTLALSLLGEIRPGLHQVAGTVEVAGERPLLMRARERRSFRRDRTAWLGQDPAAALTPTMSVAALIGEPLPRRDRTRQRIEHALTAVGLPSEPAFWRRRPHAISGGQRRRVALARALVRDPELLILDEPVAGLDVRSRRQVLAELAAVRQARPVTLVVISHDVDAVAELTDELIIMERGRIVEHGPTAGTLALPESQTTRDLVDALKPASLRAMSPEDLGPVVLSVESLTAAVPNLAPVVTEATFTIAAGEGVAIVGESGVGKTTLARTLVGLNPARTGRIDLHGCEPGQQGRIGFVPQDPATALNPARTVRSTLAEALRRAPSPTSRSVVELLETVGLDPLVASRRPDSLSGGQRQRVAIARALAGAPDLLICDEPTSALDPVLAAALLDLLNRLRTGGLAVIVISHELHNIGRVATRVLELREHALVPMTAERLLTLTPHHDTPYHERSSSR